MPAGADSGTGRAIGSGRIGILVEGASPFVGDITNTGTITIEGNSSAGVRVDADLDGSYVSSVTETDENGIESINGSSISVVGDNSFGLDVQGNVSGDVIVDDVVVRGENTQAVNIDGDIGGGLVFLGGTSASGFDSTNRRNREEDRDLLDADDLASGGATITVAGDVGAGILVSGRSGDETDEDGDGVLDNVPQTGTVDSFGDAPAILISTNLDDANDPINIGEVADADGFGLVVRGPVRANGVNDDFDATAVRIEGNASEQVDIAGGLSVGPLASISAAAFSGDADGRRYRRKR